MSRRHWESWRQTLFDAGPALCVLVVLAALVIRYGLPDDVNGWTGLVVQTGLGVALLFRRRAALAVTTAVTLGAVAMLLSVYLAPGLLVDAADEGALWVPLATPFAVSGAVLHASRHRLTWVLAAVLTLIATRPWDTSVGVVTAGLLFTAVPVLLGMYAADRQRLIQALTDRAERAEREQHLLARQARAEERVRLAGEMHDVVTHRVSLMVLQAGALRVTAPDERTRDAAEELRAAGCQALEELRDLIGVLRSSAGSPATVASPATAASMVDAGPGGSSDGSVVPLLADLVAESESVGVPVNLVEDGNPLFASPVVARTAYRVVQEALTNVRKHAPGAATRVHVRYGADRVRLTVSNSFPTHPRDTALSASGSGTGLLGLRQRVELVGGTLRARPEPDGGFTLDATLPAYVPTTPMPENSRHGS
ncbi:sensor histidine kinase [Streptoalloteichus tenebrarius]|uniref:sensor histidine kinase n=1 Tax=Streptoalloteichus tenebrarius (strain ATCC 17920 / DSM 40477 / JCM 4838 / CBS 697.72 / NBRC 16177 / NCIMB 11028 / NRRL B-12390 / A12253. 1 / ISP 5477) TaxID=1933 RepID=UPI0020A4E992|nr:histidine kinase [Streptoalloteichus tenebrarius]